MLALQIFAVSYFGGPPATWEVVFSANKVLMSSKGKVTEPGRSEIYSLDVESKKIRKIASSTLDLNFPKITGKNRLMMLEHSEKSGKNTLVLVDKKSGHRINTASLPNGEIDRIKLVQNGKFVLVYYHTKKENYGSIRDSKKIVIFRDFKPYFTAMSVLDATIDIDGFSVLTTRHGTNPLTSIFNGEKTSVPIPLPMSKGVRNLATDDNGAVFAFSVLDYRKFYAGIRSVRNPAFQTSGLTGSEKEENDMTLSEFGDFEAMYGNHLWYDHQLNQFLIGGTHGMSDGHHDLTIAIDSQTNQMRCLCEGNYLGINSTGETIGLIRPWLGPYKRGGERIGRIFSSKAARKSVYKQDRFLTPQSLSVKEAYGVNDFAGQSN